MAVRVRLSVLLYLSDCKKPERRIVVRGTCALHKHFPLSMKHTACETCKSCNLRSHRCHTDISVAARWFPESLSSHARDRPHPSRPRRESLEPPDRAQCAAERSLKSPRCAASPRTPAVHPPAAPDMFHQPSCFGNIQKCRNWMPCIMRLQPAAQYNAT